MKRILMILSFLLLMMSGCGQNSTAEEVLKRDENMPFIYAETMNEFNLIRLLKDSHYPEAIRDLGLWDLKELYPLLKEKQHAFGVEFIHINIDSKDALALEEELHQASEQATAVNQESKEQIGNESYDFTWKTWLLYDAFENEASLSFMIFTYDIRFDSNGKDVNFLAYTFDRRNGEQLSHDDLMKQKGVKQKTIQDFIVEKVTADLKEEQAADLLVLYEENEKDIDTNKENVLYLRIRPENGIAVKGDTLILIIEAYSPGDSHDEFKYYALIDYQLTE